MIKPETLTEMLEESIGSLDDFTIEVKGGDFVINDSVRIDLALLCEKLNAHNPPPEPSDNYPDELVERIKCASVQSGEAYTFEQFKKWANEPSSPSTVKRKDLR